MNLGTLSVKRSEFENFILMNGGTIAKTITNSVTHLVTYVDLKFFSFCNTITLTLFKL